MTVDLDAIRNTWLGQCGPCDASLPGACTCVQGDPRTVILDLVREIERLDAEAGDLRALFELQWTRTREADARWRAEDPTARAHIMPDLGELLRWLMDDADQVRSEVIDMQPICRAADQVVQAMQREAIRPVDRTAELALAKLDAAVRDWPRATNSTATVSATSEENARG
ncbi:hypothetical protein [Catenuloplanes japonicus]|uniref:hypothetical protein n=1 Tax=Catenuloplanes japonicus TaxID=33876 RepID=UPI0005248540|nr:hypothetical protein [Catenuloplanes japonicus]